MPDDCNSDFTQTLNLAIVGRILTPAKARDLATRDQGTRDQGTRDLGTRDLETCDQQLR